MIVLRPDQLKIAIDDPPIVIVSDDGASVAIGIFVVRFRRIANDDLVGGDVVVDPHLAMSAMNEIAIGSDLIDQLRVLAVALLEQKLNPDTVRCQDCRAILRLIASPSPRSVTEIVCGPIHEIRFSDGSAISSR